MIEIKNISHSLGKKKVLDGLSLTIPDGTIVGLCGVNGSGKSTLLRIIAGVYNPDEGEVLLDGKNVQVGLNRQRLFYLPDDPYYTINTTGESLFQMYKTFYPNMDSEVFRRLLGYYSIDSKQTIRQFSKGMRRQLYISLAISTKSKYLLLDEAFDGLDPMSRQIFKKEIIESLEENDSSVIIASHSLRELEDFCDYYALINDKSISSFGHIDEKVNTLCRFQLAFRDDVSESIFEGLPVETIEKSGRFFKVTLNCTADEASQKLEALDPLIMEEMKIDFEEAFINEVKKTIGDV